MKKASLIILTAFFTFSLYSQKSLTEIDKLESAKRQIKTGTIFTLSGIGTTALGTVLLATGMEKKDPPAGRINGDTHTSIGGFIGFGLMLAGPVLVIIGIPDIIYGSIKKDRAMSNLKMTVVTFKSFDNAPPVPGIGLCFNF